MARYVRFKLTETELDAVLQLIGEADFATFEDNGNRKRQAAREKAAARAIRKLEDAS